MRSHGRAARTGALLQQLLMSKPHYRHQWCRRTTRARVGLSQSAVAKVIEEYLWDSGERSDNLTRLARQLKDRISRALNGEELSAETLKWFICAFGMDEADESRLWSAFLGAASAIGVSHTLRQRREMIRPQHHRTVSVIERYSVDQNGSLTLRRTYHTIRAVEDGVDSYIFNHEPEASLIQVIHGGHLGVHYEYGGGLTSEEIVLDDSLEEAESTVLEYQTHFEPHSTDLTEVRRAAFARSENVDLAIEFDQVRMPARAWWCAWDDHFGDCRLIEKPIQARNGIIRKHFPFIEESVVGFRWDW
jgi:hypothetical protein